MRLPRLLPLFAVLLVVSCFSAQADEPAPDRPADVLHPPALTYEDELSVDVGAPDGIAQRERIDARLLANTDDEVPPSPEQLAASDELSRRVGGRLRADFNPLNGTPRLLFARGSFLSDPSLDSPRTVAGSFLLDHADLFAVSPEFVSSLVESRVFKNENSGITHVQYEQQYEGLEVFQSTIRIAVTAEGRVLTVTGDYYPELSLPNTDPALSREAAMDAAFGEVGPPRDFPPLESDPDPMTASVRELYAPTAELVVFPLPHKGAALAWRVGVPQFVDFWDLVVDANSGALLYVDNLTKDTDPEGQVFLEHPDAGAQVTVPFVGPLPAPRDAWVGTNLFLPLCETCTSGNNATAIEDRNSDFDGSAAFDPQAHFNFGFANSYAATGNPDADELTSITNLFYLINVSHDHFYQLGFTEAAGNFQNNNFGAGGASGDPVFATTYTGWDVCNYLPDFNCRNNAWFATSPDGSPPLMQTFLFTSPPLARRDPSLDGDIVIHEYGHGVSTRLVGVGGLSGTQSGPMGEGWSDYFPISFYDDAVMGEYGSGNAVTGIRRYAYDASPLTYGDLCTGPPGCEVHYDGEIWAAALWDLREFYVSQLGLPAGQEAADELIVEGLMLTPPSPSMLDARDAILQAELAMGGVNQCAVWQVFADRGMGYSATSAGDTEAVTEAFDLPLACQDFDGDGVPDDTDKCPETYDPDQDDYDGDGVPGTQPPPDATWGGDACDDDDDNDTVLDGDDVDPLDEFACRDVDADTCDDCSVLGTADPSNDGTDTDSAGICDAGDHDDDNDGWKDDEETAAASDRLDAGSTPEVCDGIDNDGDCPGDTNGDGIVCGTGTDWDNSVYSSNSDVGVDEDFADNDGNGSADCYDDRPGASCLYDADGDTICNATDPNDDDSPNADPFTDLEENYMGTNKDAMCSPGTGPDNDPLDNDADGQATILDYMAYFAFGELGTQVANDDQAYKRRLDLDADGQIGILDIMEYFAFGQLGEDCPYGL